MAANMYGIDLGEIYRTKEAVEGARTRNKLSSLQLGEVEREIAERPAKEAAIQSALSTGDKDALNSLFTLDIDTAKTIADQVSKMSEKEKEQSKENRLEIARMSSYILDSKTPNEASARLKQVANSLPEDLQSQLYSELEASGGDPMKYADMALRRIMDVNTIFENPKVVQVAGEDVAYKAGREVERKTRPVKTSGTGSDGGGVKSADESLMYRQSVELLGGLFDQAGNITNLDPTVRNKVQGIATEATNIFREGGVTRSQAVKQAAQKFGLEVPDAGSTVDNDPLGIR